MKLYRFLTGALTVHLFSALPYASFVWFARPSEKPLIWSLVIWAGSGAVIWLTLIGAMFVHGWRAGKPANLLELIKKPPA